MKDSNLWYYLILGAIYLLTKFFGKKKTEQPPHPAQDSSNIPPSATPSFEGLLEEITGKSKAQETVDIPVDKAPAVATDWMQEAVITTPPSKFDNVTETLPPPPPTKSGDLTFERHIHFELPKEDTEARERLTALLYDHDGLRQAFVLKEVLDRRY